MLGFIDTNGWVRGFPRDWIYICHSLTMTDNSHQASLVQTVTTARTEAETWLTWPPKLASITAGEKRQLLSCAWSIPHIDAEYICGSWHWPSERDLRLCVWPTHLSLPVVPWHGTGRLPFCDIHFDFVLHWLVEGPHWLSPVETCVLVTLPARPVPHSWG